MMGKNGLLSLNNTDIFDESIRNNSKSLPKEEALVEIVTDYNNNYGHSFSIPTYQKFKKDVY